jgi:Short C-terminal domain
LIIGVFGLLVGIGALAIPNAPFFGSLLIVLGLAYIVGAPKQAIEVTNSGGGQIRFPVSFFERGRTFEFASEVAEAIARTPASREPSGSRSPAPRDQNDVGDPGEGLRNLSSLRDQGLITDSEYADKRAEILRRL